MLLSTISNFGLSGVKTISMSWSKSTQTGQVLVHLSHDKGLKKLFFFNPNWGDFFSKFHLNVYKTGLENLLSQVNL